VTWLYTFLAGLVVSGLAVWQVQDWRYGERVNEMKYTASESARLGQRASQNEADRRIKEKDDALKRATERAQQNTRAADLARDESDGLRNQLAAADAALSTAADDAVRKYAATANTVLAACTARYIDVARDAAGHASDSLMYQEAWPK
jgi:hypothetical protein